MSHPLEWLPSKSLQTINAGEGVGKRETSYTVGGNANQYSHYGEQCGDSLKKLEKGLPYDPAVPLLGIHTEETRIERDMCSTVYNNQGMEATQMPIGRRIDKEVLVHMHNGILLSYKKNMFESVLMRWMKLEPIIQSEAGQKEKQQYSIPMHIHGIQKDSNDNLVCKAQKRHRCEEQTTGLCGIRRGWDNMRKQH